MKSVHLNPNDRLVSTQHPSLPNMSDNAFTSLSEEHAYLTVMAVALMKVATNKTVTPPECIKEVVRSAIGLVWGTMLHGKFKSAKLLELSALAI